MPEKKNTKSNFLAVEFEDFADETKKYAPKNKKTTKRPQVERETNEINESSLSETNKKQKVNANVQNGKEIRGKLLEAMESQIKTRKHHNESLLSSLSELMDEIKEDCVILKSNQEQLHKLAAALVKCVSQANTALERKLTTLNEIYSSFKEKCAEEESDHKSQASKLANELEEDVKKLHQKLVAETRRTSLENLRKSIFQSMQIDF